VNAIYEFALGKNHIVRIMLINVFALLMCVLVYFYLNINNFIENAIAMVSVAMFLVVLNGLIIRNGLRNEHEKRQLEIYEAYYPVMERLTCEMRKKQHDFNNHIQTVSAIVDTSKSLTEAKELVKLYGNEIKENQKGEEFINIRNRIIAGFLYSKYCEIIEKGYRVEFEIQSSLCVSPVSDYDIVEILGILLDNAIEATEKENIIGLVAFTDDTINLIVKNTSPYLKHKELQKIFSEGYSTKGAERGLGLSKLKEIINKYNGEILVENEMTEKQQNIVTFHVLIPKKEV
jgi:sensor histidine kinase regulating citrate/malate metabolism